MNDVIEYLRERGLVDQITSEDLKEHLKKPIRAYVGFDPTADSLHLGNLLGIIVLAWFQRFGHTPVVILGGATGLIGDPSGKSTERPLLSQELLQANVQSLETFFRAIFHFPQGPQPLILNNESWFRDLSYIDFLRDVGKYFRLGPMLAKESVRTRLESEEGMSYTEFSYQALQGYDFYHLHKKHAVSLQMGGSDQWGNITAGIELNRKLGEESVYGLTFPLLTRSDGKKFGKTEEGAVWLSAHKLSPYHFYQYLFRIPDADVIGLLKKLTFLDLEEIQEIEAKISSAPNQAQKRLAEEVTRFVHGEDGLEIALRVTTRMAPGAETDLNADSLRQLAADLPQMSLKEGEVVGQKFIDVALKAKLVPSKSEAARLIQNGGAYLNNGRISDPSFVVRKEHLIEETYLLLGAGKKRRILVTIVSTKNSFEK